MEGSTPDSFLVTGSPAGAAIDPAAFCGVAARMLAAGGRANITALLILLSQALCADVELREPDRGGGGGPAGWTSSAPPPSIPRPRIRSATGVCSGAAPGAGTGISIDLPVRSRGIALAVLSIEPSSGGIPEAWVSATGPLTVVADLLALALSAEPTVAPSGVAPSGVAPSGVAPSGVAAGPTPAHTRAVAAAWFECDERDRADLAGHLHDGLVQSLIAARYLLDLAVKARPDGAQPWLATLRESLQEALADGRGLMTSLQPRTRHERGLRLALDELCAGSRFPVTLVAAPEHPEVTPQLSPVVAAAAYRFAQAAVADLQARGATAAEVRLTYRIDGLTLDVVPGGGADGRSSALLGSEPGAALERWARRLDLLGGRIVLDPAAAQLCFGAADGEAAPPGAAAAAVRPTVRPTAGSASPTRTPLSAGSTT